MMHMSEFTGFQKTCDILCRALPSPYTVSWDEDFHVIRIVFRKTGQEPLRQALKDNLPCQWDFTTIDSAPEFIDNFINSIFGIIPGQFLFTSRENPGPMLFAVWWPWGNEDYISLRVGIYLQEDTLLSRTQVRSQLTTWFPVDS